MFLSRLQVKPHSVFDFNKSERVGYIPMHVLEAGKFNENPLKLQIISCSETEVSELFSVVANVNSVINCVKKVFGSKEFVFANQQHSATLVYDMLYVEFKHIGQSDRVARILTMIYIKILLAVKIVTFDGSILSFSDSAFRESDVINPFMHALLMFNYDHIEIESSITEALILDKIKGNRASIVFIVQVINTYIRELFLELSTIINEGSDIFTGLYIVSNAITQEVTLKEVISDRLYSTLKTNLTFTTRFVMDDDITVLSTDGLSKVEVKMYLAKASAFISKYFFDLPFADAVRHLSVVVSYAIDNPDVITGIGLIKKSNLSKYVEVFRTIQTSDMAWLSSSNFKPTFENLDAWELTQSAINAFGNFTVAQFEAVKAEIIRKDPNSDLLLESKFSTLKSVGPGSPIIITNCDQEEIYDWIISQCNGGAFIDHTSEVRFMITAAEGTTINYRNPQLSIDGSKTLVVDSLNTNDPLDVLYARRLHLSPAKIDVKIANQKPELSANSNSAYINYTEFLATVEMPNLASYQLDKAEFTKKYNNWGVTFSINGSSKYEKISLGQEVLGGLPATWPITIEIGRITDIFDQYVELKSCLPNDVIVKNHGSQFEYNSYFRLIDIKLLSQLIDSVPESASLNLARLGMVQDPREYLTAEITMAIKYATLKGEIFCGYSTSVRTHLFFLLESLSRAEKQNIGSRLL